MDQRIRVVSNQIEYGFSCELGGRQLSLVVIRATKEQTAAVIISMIEAETEEYISYSPAEFLALLKEVASPFLEALA